MTGDNALYPIGYKGGIPGYKTRKQAENAIEVISKHDKKYVEPRGGLKTEAVLAKSHTLQALNIYLHEEED